MTSPDVTIILPVHNAGDGLEASLLRIDRTCPDNSEIILVDDGSTDGTSEIVRKFAASRSHAHAVHLKANSGVAVARNTALRLARGKYVWFVDWDDEWDNDIVRVLLARANSTLADIVVCRTTWRLSTGLDVGFPEGIRDDVYPGSKNDGLDLALRGDLKGYLWSKLLRRDLLSADMFPPMRSQSDFCGLLPVIASARRVAFEPRVLYHHVIREGSITNSRQPNLDNLTKCRETVRACASSDISGRDRDSLLLHYDYAYWHLARVKTALRLSSESVARHELGTASRAMRFSEIVRVARISPGVALQCSLIKILGQYFITLRQRYITVRAMLRSMRLAIRNIGRLSNSG